MTDKPSIESHADFDDVSPDSLMSDFRGRPMAGILIFTVLVHVVLMGVFSIRYLKSEFLGEDTSSLTEEERIQEAVKDARKSLKDIAERHGVSPLDLSERFANVDSKPSTPTVGQPEDPKEPGTPTVPGDTPPEDPKSAIETELQKKADGPDLPPLQVTYTCVSKVRSPFVRLMLLS
jgi:hypothetical protein